MGKLCAHIGRLATAAALVSPLLLTQPASALLIAYDGFDYAAGDLLGQNGGTGDWKAPWTGDGEIDVILGGSSYVDTVPNALNVEGNRLEIDVAGTAKAFETDFVRVQLETAVAATFDEVRIGDLYVDVTPHTVMLPEPSTCVLLGMGLAGRRAVATA